MRITWDNQAQEVYEESLETYKQLDDIRGQTVNLEQLGTLASKMHNYAEAQQRFIEVLDIFRTLSEPEGEANVLHLLGSLALEQKKWIEAESWYRESLTINESLGNIVNAGITCNQLAIVARRSGRPIEAEGWYKRELELDEYMHFGSLSHAQTLSNFATLLEDEILKKHIPEARLNEAKSYAEQALSIMETFDASSGIWATLSILANIADLEGRTQESRAYRRRERETFAAFEGNRYHIDRQYGQFMTNVAVAAKGDAQARAEVEAALPDAEKNGWHISDAIHRIWAGERNWHTLTENMGGQQALLMLRVLETIAQPAEAQNIIPEQVIASLPVAIREAMGRGDEAAFEKAFEALSSEEQQAVLAAIQFLQGQQVEGDDEDVAGDGE